jgi:hypothetical protein
MSIRTKIFIITILAGCAILHVTGISLMTSASDRSTAEPMHLYAAD